MQRQSAKIATKMRERRQRPKSKKGGAGNPRRNALFGVVSEMCGLRRLDGGRTRARTWDPLIKSLVLVMLSQWLGCKFPAFET